MSGVLARKLDSFVTLSYEEKEALNSLERERVRRFEARDDIFRLGERPSGVVLLLDGWGYRYKDLRDGRRQILSVALPGDFGDVNSWLLDRMDHSYCTVTPVTAAVVSRESLVRIAQRFPRIARAFSLETLVTTAIQREWTVGLGQRNAFERLAHLFCEIYVRMSAIGQVTGNTFFFPLTQTDIGDAAGLSVVHVNRTLQELRANRLVILKDKMLSIPRFEALSEAADFNIDYLYLSREGRLDDG